MRMYIIPVKKVCNASCTFCYMKEKKEDNKKEFIDFNNLKDIIKNNNFDEIEITGGGEPTLHPQISNIIKMIKTIKPNTYIKLYTNGFNLVNLKGLDEINISRVHWDSDINNKFYQSKQQNELSETINYYYKMIPKIRLQTILLKGAIDTEDKALNFIKKFEDKVDVFMFRHLFDKCSLEKDNFIKFNIEHPKVKMDITLDNYDRDLLFVTSEGEVFNHFLYD